jgi:hypothetical protein
MVLKEQSGGFLLASEQGMLITSAYLVSILTNELLSVLFWPIL